MEQKWLSRVYLTDHGRFLREPVTAVWQRVEARLVTPFTAAERAELRRLLSSLHENLLTDA